MTKTIEIKNIAAIRSLSIPIPEDGGVVVLRGRSGSGKSTAIRAVESLVGKPTVAASDGAPKGEIVGPGVKMVVGRSSRKTGELEVETLEGRLNISDLIDPQLKDPVRADAKRIKALVSLTGADLDTERFVGLAGSREEFERVTEGLDISGEVLERVRIVKEAFESAARGKEGLADAARARGDACTQEVREDQREPVDTAELDQELERWIRHETKLREQQETAERAAGRAVMARKRLGDLVTPDETKETERVRFLEECIAGHRKTVDRDRDFVETARDKLEKARKVLEDCEKSVAESARVLEQAERERDDASKILKNLASHAETRKQLEETIRESEAIECPSDEEIHRATGSVAVAREAIRDNTLLVELRKKTDEAKRWHDEAAAHFNEAVRLRKVGRDAEGLLSDLIGSKDSPLQVSDGRLVLETDRGLELYDDLSDGERALVAIEAVVPFVGRGGLVPLAQRIWQDLEPQAKAKVSQEARVRGVTVVTAEVTAEDGIKAEVMP